MNVNGSHVGQHGTLTRGANELHGTIENASATVFIVQIDGVNRTNRFTVKDWDFTPDPQPIPTTPGSIVSVGGNYGTRYVRVQTGWAALSSIRGDFIPNVYADERFKGVEWELIFDAGKDA